MSAAPDERKQPWKHPAVWPSHAVAITLAAPDGVYTSIATCECGWSSRVKLGRGGAGHVEQDDAVTAHWQCVIAAATKGAAA